MAQGSKIPPANEGYTRDAGLIPGLRRFLGEGSGNPRQYSCHGVIELDKTECTHTHTAIISAFLSDPLIIHPASWF